MSRQTKIDSRFKTMVQSLDEALAMEAGLTVEEYQTQKHECGFVMTDEQFLKRKIVAATWNLKMAEALYIADPTRAHFENWQEARRDYRTLTNPRFQKAAKKRTDR